MSGRLRTLSRRTGRASAAWQFVDGYAGDTMCQHRQRNLANRFRSSRLNDDRRGDGWASRARDTRDATGRTSIGWRLPLCLALTRSHAEAVGMNIATLDIAIIVLLLIISVVGVLTRSSRVPYPIALVITGLALGALLRSPLPFVSGLALDELQLTPHLILVLFLPALLFEAALHIEGATLRKTLLPIGLLAAPGVVLTALIVGALLHWGIGLDWPTGLLFGAIISATDPSAVLAIFRRLGAPHELEVLIEGESLFNDGTAVVLSRILLAAVLAGSFDLGRGILDFVVVVAGGMLLGALAGALVSRLSGRIDVNLIEMILTLMLTYGTFVVDDVSIISVVVTMVV